MLWGKAGTTWVEGDTQDLEKSNVEFPRHQERQKRWVEKASLMRKIYLFMAGNDVRSEARWMKRQHLGGVGSHRMSLVIDRRRPCLQPSGKGS